MNVQILELNQTMYELASISFQFLAAAIKAKKIKPESTFWKQDVDQLMERFAKTIDMNVSEEAQQAVSIAFSLIKASNISSAKTRYKVAFIALECGIIDHNQWALLTSPSCMLKEEDLSYENVSSIKQSIPGQVLN